MAELDRPRRPHHCLQNRTQQQQNLPHLGLSAEEPHCFQVLPVTPKLHDSLVEHDSEDTCRPAEGDGASIPGRVREHICHDGAHMNAAVTFTNCVLGRMSWKKFPVYVLGQFLGSFLAAATTYCLFYDSLMHFSGGELTVTGPRATAGIFATYLPQHVSLWQGFFDEAVLTGLLQMCIFAITDKQNNSPPEGAQALVIGVLVIAIGVCLGMNTGYAINPSRDLPPRFFTFLAGWGHQVFSAGDSWWWVPVVAPFLGAFFGGALYLLLVGFNIPRELESMEDSVIFEEQRTTALPKTSPNPFAADPLTPVTVSSKVSAKRPPAQSVPPLSDPALPLEHL
ncbi:aquaporin-7 isoform X4 [Tamandua tetradactyla]|uniref:aquaporin-7 isoform X4 n=1 Tax=Tamandua tetradactyla TaxID=48850 RepID=UPI0040549339